MTLETRRTVMCKGCIRSMWPWSVSMSTKNCRTELRRQVSHAEANCAVCSSLSAVMVIFVKVAGLRRAHAGSLCAVSEEYWPSGCVPPAAFCSAFTASGISTSLSLPAFTAMEEGRRHTEHSVQVELFKSYVGSGLKLLTWSLSVIWLWAASRNPVRVTQRSNLLLTKRISCYMMAH